MINEAIEKYTQQITNSAENWLIEFAERYKEDWMTVEDYLSLVVLELPKPRFFVLNKDDTIGSLDVKVKIYRPEWMSDKWFEEYKRRLWLR